MADVYHNEAFRALDLLGGLRGHLRRTGEVIDASHEINGHLARDLAHQLAKVMVHTVEVQVTLEDAWATLRVVPPGLASILFRALGRHQTIHGSGTHLTAVDVRVPLPVEPPAR